MCLRTTFIFSLPFSSEQEIQQALRDLRRFLDEMQSFGLRINTSKTGFMLYLRGRRSSKWRSKLIRGSGSGATIRLESLEQHGEPLYIPLVHEQKYLGIILSYRRSSDATLKFRRGVAMGTFTRLRRWWGSRFALRERIKLWYQTVWPTLCYGIAEVGLTKRGLRIFSGLVFRQLRRLARSPLHKTHESNEALCQRLNICHPVTQLCCSVFKLWQRRITKLDILSPNDFLQNIPLLCRRAVDAEFALHSWWQLCLPHWSRLEQGELFKDAGQRVCSLLGLQAASCVRSPLPLTDHSLEAPAEQFRCDLCEKIFPTQMALRVHANAVHAPIPRSVLKFSVALDSIDGLPICRHCNLKFAKWQGLRQHLDKDTCPFRDARRAIHEGMPLQEDHKPLLHSQSLRNLVDTEGAESLLDYAWYCDIASHTCIVCTQWCASGGALAYHMRTAHHDLYVAGRHWCIERLRAKALVVTNPCKWCHQPFSPNSILQKHYCAVAVQAGLVACDVSSQQFALANQSDADPAAASAAASRHRSRDAVSRDGCRSNLRDLQRVATQHGRQQQAPSRRLRCKTPAESAAAFSTTATTAACKEGTQHQPAQKRRRQRVKGPPRYGQVMLEHGANPCAPRGQPEQASAGHWIPDSRADICTNITSTLSNQQALAIRKRCRTPARSAIENPTCSQLLHGTQHSAENDRRVRGHIGAHAETLARSGAESGRLLHADQMGRAFSESGCHGAWPRTARASRQTGDHGASATSSATCSQVSFKPPDGGRIPRKEPYVSSRTWTPRPTLRRSIHYPRDDVRDDCLERHSSTASASNAPKGPDSERDPEVHRAVSVAGPEVVHHSVSSTSSTSTSSSSSTSTTALRMDDVRVVGNTSIIQSAHGSSAVSDAATRDRLFGDDALPTSAFRTWMRHGRGKIPLAMLSNPGNYCYCNATIAALLVCFQYTVSKNKALLTSWGCILDIATSACGDWSGLFSVPGFRKMMQGWLEPDRQHDAADFLRHISRDISLLRAPVACARCLQDREVIQEEGLLALELASDPTVLTSALHHWHKEQGFVYGLLEAPPILCIPLVRFEYVDRLPIRANARVTLEQVYLELPIFMADSIETHSVLYRIVACILHRGPTPTSGHYRMLALLDDEFIVTDDDSLGPYLEKPLEEDEREISLVYLIRMDCL